MNDEGEVFDPAPDEPAEVAQLDTTRAQRVAQAYISHVVNGHSITMVAEELGVSRATAWRMAKEGEAQAALIPWLRVEQVKLGQQVQLRAMRSWLYSDAQVESAKALDYVPTLLKVMELEMKLAGTGAPTNHNFTGLPAGPDPDTIAAIQAALEQTGELPS